MFWCYTFYNEANASLFFSPHGSAKMNAKTKIAHAHGGCAFALPCYEVKRTHIEIKLTCFCCWFQSEHNEFLYFIFLIYLE